MKPNRAAQTLMTQRNSTTMYIDTKMHIDNDIVHRHKNTYRHKMLFHNQAETHNVPHVPRNQACSESGSPDSFGR